MPWHKNFSAYLSIDIDPATLKKFKDPPSNLPKFPENLICQNEMHGLL